MGDLEPSPPQILGEILGRWLDGLGGIGRAVLLVSLIFGSTALGIVLLPPRSAPTSLAVKIVFGAMFGSITMLIAGFVLFGAAIVVMVVTQWIKEGFEVDEVKARHRAKSEHVAGSVSMPPDDAQGAVSEPEKP